MIIAPFEKMKDNLIIDCFAGGGGASVGIEMALGRPVDIAVNHDPDAILIHKTNHPDTLHLTEDIFKVDLEKYVKGRHVALMWASPDCTSHSKAKGGKPREKGLRILPWAVYKHARKILPDVIIMENVEEIQQWGALDDNGHPIPERKGEDYKKFINAMKSLGYEFDSRELVAADYGAPTTRKRWYAVFRRDGKKIEWPVPTHSKGGVNRLKPWKPIWKCLDLQDVGKSIFGRKKPLAENTMKRIARGIEKFVFNCPEPFIMKYYGGTYKGSGSSIHDPIHTITTLEHHSLITPYIVPIGYGERQGQKPRVNSVEEPIGTIVAGGTKHYLCSSFLIQYHSETTKDGMRGQAVTEPIQTIDTSNRYGLVNVYAIPKEQLVKVIDCVDEEQAKDIVQKCTWVSQFIMEYYGCGTGQSLNDPLHTIVTKDRFALITVLGNEYAILDIFLRMLKAEPELKLGQGFPHDYIIDHDYTGKKYPVRKQVARIGNSVVPIMAEKLVEANCGYLKVGERMPNMRIDDSGKQLRFA